MSKSQCHIDNVSVCVSIPHLCLFAYHDDTPMSPQSDSSHAQKTVGVWVNLVP